MSSMTLQTSEPLVHQNLQASSRSAREIARMIAEHGDLSPAYQRGSVWSREQRMGLIRSWLLGLPIPAVIINDRIAAKWRTGSDGLPVGGHVYAVVDGKQRIETALAWFGDELEVPASWFPAQDVETTRATEDGPYVSYMGLTMPAQRRFSTRALVPTVEARAASIAEEASIYLLVNGAGVAQTADDMENARAIASEGQDA